MDALAAAVEAHPRALGASVSGAEDGASVFVSVDAESATDATTVSERIVADALQELGLGTQASALQVYDADGNFVA